MERRDGMEYGCRGEGEWCCINVDQVVSMEHEIDGTEERTESACYFHVKMSWPRNFFICKRELSKRSFRQKRKKKGLSKLKERFQKIIVRLFRRSGSNEQEIHPSALLPVSLLTINPVSWRGLFRYLK